MAYAPGCGEAAGAPHRGDEVRNQLHPERAPHRHNRERLAEHGILFACERWRQQVLAVRELIDRGGPNQEPITPDGPWQHLVDVVNEWPGTAIVSMEFLAPRKEPKIAVIQEAFAGADLQVVLTARDLARSLPAMWTESTQNRGVRTWEEFLDAVRHEDMAQKPGRWFWKHQRLADIASRWSDAVGRDHFTLITVPPTGAPPGVLWDRFAAVAGIPEGLCDTEVRSNPGIDAASALVLRALNERLAQDEFSPQDYERLVKGALAKQGLVKRGRDSVPPGDRRALGTTPVQARSCDKLRKLDIRVVGDIDELEAQAGARRTHEEGDRRAAARGGPRRAGLPGQPSGTQTAGPAPADDDLDYTP